MAGGLQATRYNLGYNASSFPDSLPHGLSYTDFTVRYVTLAAENVAIASLKALTASDGMS